MLFLFISVKNGYKYREIRQIDSIYSASLQTRFTADETNIGIDM